MQPRLTRPRVLVPVIALVAVLLAAGALTLRPAAVRIADTSATANCSVDYAVGHHWNTGFTANIRLTNLGSPVTSWSLRYRYPGHQHLLKGWDGHWSQHRHTVRVRNDSSNGRLATGRSALIHASFSYGGANAAPRRFVFDGTRCTGAPVPAPTPSASPTTTATPTPTPSTSPTPTPTPTRIPTPSPSPSSPSPSPSSSPPAGSAPQLQVSGNELVSATGQRVILHGVDRSGTEYACVQGWGIFDGPSDQASITAMKSFGINAVRIPLNEACWNGESYVNPADAGANYQAAITSYVSLLNSNGIVAILDLHWTDGAYTGSSSGCSSAQATCQKPMPDAAQALPFWTSVARTFKGNNAVIFDLFNEPYPERADSNNETEGWQCWLNGGDCAGISYPVTGMQAMVNAVRSTGASNVLMLGGLEYSNDLTQWLSHEPADPDHDLAASLHSYSFNACADQACWDSQVAPVIARVPVIAGEIGESDCADTYIDGLMSWLDSEQTSYLAWAWNADFNCSSGPGLITSYDGTPTAYGAGYESHLKALAGG